MNDLIKLIDQVEKAHFRTVDDTGANSCAMLIWNIVRNEAGLPRLQLSDLPAYCKSCKRYHGNGECSAKSIAQVNAALKKAGHSEELVKGKGYLYFSGPSTATWRSTSVMVPHVKRMSVKKWIEARNELAAVARPTYADMAASSHGMAQDPCTACGMRR